MSFFWGQWYSYFRFSGPLSWVSRTYMWCIPQIHLWLVWHISTLSGQYGSNGGAWACAHSMSQARGLANPVHLSSILCSLYTQKIRLIHVLSFVVGSVTIFVWYFSYFCRSVFSFSFFKKELLSMDCICCIRIVSLFTTLQNVHDMSVFSLLLNQC